MATFDLVVLGLLILGGATGFRKGLITGFSRFAGKIIAIGTAIIFHRQFLHTLDSFFGLRGVIEPKIGAFLSKLIESKAAAGGLHGDKGTLVQPVIGEATISLTDYVMKIGSVILLFILASLVINLIITMIITPLAKSLGVVDRGGGLAFGVLSMLVGVCLVVGLLAPFLATANTGAFQINQSLLYPWLIQGYDLIRATVSGFAGDIFVNPLDVLPFLKETAV